MKLLIVEDDLYYAEYLQAAIQGENHEILCSIDTKLSTALEVLTRESFDAVLLDLTLPDSPREATVQAVWTIAPLVPVIVMTGAHDETVAVEAIRAGAQDFLLKDRLLISNLLKCLFSAIDRHRRAAEATRAFEAAGVPSTIPQESR